MQCKNLTQIKLQNTGIAKKTGDEFTSLVIFIEFFTFLAFSASQYKVHASVETLTWAKLFVLALEGQFDPQFYNSNLHSIKME